MAHFGVAFGESEPWLVKGMMRLERMSAISTSLLLACATCLVGCNAQKPGELPNPEAYMQASGGPEREVRIKVEDYHFSPSLIVAKPGEKLRLVLTSQGNQEHGITVDLPPGAKSSHEHVHKGETMQLEMTVPSVPGRYNFYCPVGDHFSRGMTGQIVAQP